MNTRKNDIPSLLSNALRYETLSVAVEGFGVSRMVSFFVGQISIGGPPSFELMNTYSFFFGRLLSMAINLGETLNNLGLRCDCGPTSRHH